MNFDQLTRTDLIAARINCDESLMFFTRFWFRVLHGTRFIINDHHHVIADNLRKIETYEIELLNINIPPRFSKTELAAVNFIARGIGMNPTSNWLYITASDELRAQTSVAIRDIVQHPYFKIMYGVDMKADQNGKNLWRTSKGGGLKTATIFGQITGFGAGQMIDHQDTDIEDYLRTFEGCIVLDDINKIDDSGQENATNEKVSRVLMNTVLSRKNSKDTPIINIQQRAGVSDATAIFEDFYKGSTKAVFLVMPVITDGVPLWPWKCGIDEINRLKNSPLTESTFETQYMQNPLPCEGDLLLPLASLKFADTKLIPFSNFNYLFAVGDPADTGGDKYASPFLGVRVEKATRNGHEYTDVNIYLLGALCNTDGIVANSLRIVEKRKQYCSEHVYIEKNGVGLASCIELQRYLPSGILKPFTSTDNKDVRILSNYDFVRNHFIFDTNYQADKEYKQFMSDLTTYSRSGNNKHKKDAIDVLCTAADVVKVKYRSVLY